MAMEVKVPPMVDRKEDAGLDWFLCDGCLAYHPPEYRGNYESDYKKYCHFALSIIRGEENRADDTQQSSISQSHDIDDEAVTLTSPIETTCLVDSEPVQLVGPPTL